jgi:hypothetical protein
VLPKKFHMPYIFLIVFIHPNALDAATNRIDLCDQGSSTYVPNGAFVNGVNVASCRSTSIQFVS